VISLKLPTPTGYNNFSLSIFLNGKIKVPPKPPAITNLTNSGCNKVNLFANFADAENP